MKKSFLVLFSLFSLFSFAQRINDYQYVVISAKYDFQRSPHEYQLNRLLKCQLEEYGFRTFYDTDPMYVNANDPCLFLNANVVNVSNIFLFKLMIEFTDCNKAIVYQSEIGGSKEKDRYDAFNEALDGALKSVLLAKYEFNGVDTEIDLLINQTEAANASAVTIDEAAILQNTDTNNNSPKYEVAQTEKSPTSKPKINKVDLLLAPSKNVPTKPDQIKVAHSKIEKEDKNLDATTQSKIIPVVEKPKAIGEMLLYAQAIDNGFQLVDTTPKVIIKIFKTLQTNYYTANVDEKYGAVFMKNGEWVFEYFTSGKLISEKLNVKFCD